MVFRVEVESIAQLGDEGQSTDKEGKIEGWALIAFILLMWGKELVGATPDCFCFPCETGGRLLRARGEENR